MREQENVDRNSVGRNSDVISSAAAVRTSRSCAVAASSSINTSNTRGSIVAAMAHAASLPRSYDVRLRKK